VATKLHGGSMVFQEGTSEPDKKTKKLTACHLMPHNKHHANRVAIVNSVTTKIFKPYKQLFFFVSSAYVYQCYLTLSRFVLFCLICFF
jgi:hypothetical protein